MLTALEKLATLKWMQGNEQLLLRSETWGKKYVFSQLQRQMNIIYIHVGIH